MEANHYSAPEIRNLIYDFCLSENVIHLRPRKRSWETSLRRSKPQRTYFHLSQTCRQIRYEYRPLYFRKTITHVDLHDFREYIQAFYDWYYKSTMGTRTRMAITIDTLEAEIAQYSSVHHCLVASRPPKQRVPRISKIDLEGWQGNITVEWKAVANTSACRCPICRLLTATESYSHHFHFVFLVLSSAPDIRLRVHRY